MRCNALGMLSLLCGMAAVGLPQGARADDWPQLQHDAARTGRTADSVAPNYRARWIWLGPTQTLVNTANSSTFPRATPRIMPTSVNFTIAQSVQPVLKNNQLFLGTQDGGAYGINATDGSTIWSATMESGTVATAAVAENGVIVVFVTINGAVYGLNTSNGAVAWTYRCTGDITAAPCVKGTSVFVADHKGWVTALNSATGQLLWRTRLKQGTIGSPVHGGLCADATSVYVGAENMYVYAINRTTGQIRASHRVYGQSFRMLWPVVYNNLVYASTMTTPVIGSEYVGEHNQGSRLLEDNATLADEETALALWMTGNTNGGLWPEASPDWRHYFALSTTDLSEPFTVLAAPSDGCGMPASPPAIDNSGRVLAYFKTKFPYLTKASPIFGTNFSQDISGITPSGVNAGKRQIINNGSLAGLWPWETDNLFAMSVGGNYLWLRQNFRGTQNINLSNSSHNNVEATTTNQDGGDFLGAGYKVIYFTAPESGVSNSQRAVSGRVAPVIAGTKVYFTETFCITAVEHF